MIVLSIWNVESLNINFNSIIAKFIPRYNKTSTAATFNLNPRYARSPHLNDQRLKMHGGSRNGLFNFNSKKGLSRSHVYVVEEHHEGIMTFLTRSSSLQIYIQWSLTYPDTSFPD